LFNFFKWVYADPTHNLVHNPADIRQTSTAFGVLRSTLTTTEFFLGLYFLHNKRMSIFPQVILDIFSGVFKTVTDEIVHMVFPRVFGVLTTTGIITD
jgi:hypothetical protein